MTRSLWAVGDQGFGVYDVDWNGGSPRLSPSANCADGILAPGFVDIHIHGAFGIDFMSASTNEMARLCGLLAERGYEAFLPTTVSAGARDVLTAASRLPDHEMVLGFHLEGPFLSSKFPGAQPKSHLTEPASREPMWEQVFEHPKLRLATLAPELPGALELIEGLAQRSVLVSMGHSDATYAEALAGKSAGARSVTHTFNAMRGLHHREPGLLGFALSDPDLFTELIYDRIHVSPAAARILLKCRPIEKVAAVSDCTLAAGAMPGQRLPMWGMAVEVAEGCAKLAGTDTLAGSTITLLDAFRNLASDFDVETAIRACCLNPRTTIGITAQPTVYVEFDEQLQIRGIQRIEPQTV